MTIVKLPLADSEKLETRAVLKKTALAHRYLAELKGRAVSIPNEAIFINILTLQEAKDSSEIESIITTHYELYKANLFHNSSINVAAKEVQNYASALKQGFYEAKKNRLIRLHDIIAVQQKLEQNNADIRK
ncbi:Fic/DOC family N-terminal domain-containing protein [Thorsellia anophelis]|uniref:Fic/DOC family N-terminal n=1 Tax=Thorsellia anophelis DSM 18579 TaxID=1123402 RepID=A0A1H9Z8E1_9GAMM|nr:Fic/DOC family N-terminal domain-containing protein [Thorsellia anophelis]SES77743.1 Fic/DOC family N-terminal [Thorsellia anophelis DSM 18579]